MEMLTDRQTDKKWTNERMESHQFRKEPTVNDLFSAQWAKERLFLFNICWEKIPLLAHPS